MINSVHHSQAVANYYKTEVTAPVQPSTSDVSSTDKGDAVEISPAGRKTIEALAELPEFNLDPAFHFANAETELKKLFKHYGIPQDSEVEITSNSRGEFQVEGDHPMLRQVEADLNNGDAGELRNSLIAGQTGLILQRIGAAIEIASSAADKNPSRTEFYYDWMLGVATDAKKASLSFSYDGSGVKTDLVNSSGKIITADTGLSLPS